MADVSQDQGGTPSRRPALRPFSGRPLGAGQGALRPLGARRPAVSPFAAPPQSDPTADVAQSQPLPLPHGLSDADQSAASAQLLEGATAATSILVVPPSEIAGDDARRRAIADGEEVFESKVPSAEDAAVTSAARESRSAGADASGAAHDLFACDADGAAEMVIEASPESQSDAYGEAHREVADSAALPTALDVALLGSRALVTFDSTYDHLTFGASAGVASAEGVEGDADDALGPSDGFAAAEWADVPPATDAADGEGATFGGPADTPIDPPAVTGGFTEFVVDDSAYATDDDFPWVRQAQEVEVAAPTPSDSTWSSEEFATETTWPTEDARADATSSAPDVMLDASSVDASSVDVPAVDVGGVDAWGGDAHAAADDLVLRPAEARDQMLWSSDDADASPVGLVDESAARAGAGEGGSHVAATLEMVAQRVRNGEIVATTDVNASPEAVLASVLASLLSART